MKPVGAVTKIVSDDDPGVGQRTIVVADPCANLVRAL
jgi:hypothetical protein